MLADIIPKVAEQEMLDRGSTGHGEYRPRPSNAGPDRCIRQMVYHGMGVPPKALAGRALLVFDDSSWHEELTKQWVSKSALKLHSDQLGITIPNIFPWRSHLATHKCHICKEFIKAQDLHGHLDFMVTDLAKKDWLVEHKAINHFTFQKLWDKQIWPMDYLAQMVIYFRGIWLLAKDVNRGLLLIKNKNTAQYFEIEVQYDYLADELRLVRMIRSDGEFYDLDVLFTGVFSGSIEKFRKVDQYLATRELPARPYSYGEQFPCGYCQYEETCWLGWESELKEFGAGKIKDQTIYHMATEFLQVSKTKRDAEKREKEIKKAVEEYMLENKLNKGVTPAHTILLEMKHRNGYTATPVDFQQLSISPIKAKEVLDGARKSKKSI